MELMTAAEAAKLWGITPRRIQVMCENGQIEGAGKLGFMWTIPKSAHKPIDGRTKAAKQHKLSLVTNSGIENPAAREDKWQI